MALLLCPFSLIACRGSVDNSALPYTTDVATRPFLKGGFHIGCPNLFVREGVVREVEIILRARSKACAPDNHNALTIYRGAAEAKMACTSASNSLCAKFVYRVRNVVLGIDPNAPAAVRHRLLKALRSLGAPTRIT